MKTKNSPPWSAENEIYISECFFLGGPKDGEFMPVQDNYSDLVVMNQDVDPNFYYEFLTEMESRKNFAPIQHYHYNPYQFVLNRNNYTYHITVFAYEVDPQKIQKSVELILRNYLKI